MASAAAALRRLKKQDGPILLTQGSSELIQLLLEHDLIDELLHPLPALLDCFAAVVEHDMILTTGHTLEMARAASTPPPGTDCRSSW